MMQGTMMSGARASLGKRGAMIGALVVATLVAGGFTAPAATAVQQGEYLHERQLGSPTAGDQQLLNPYGVAVDGAGDVYVTDPGAHVLKKFTSGGKYLSRWGGFGIDPGKFDFPAAVAVDARGNVFVVDTGNNRIQQFTRAGAFVRQWGETGTGDGQFKSPSGVAVGPDGSVYVVDHENNRVQRFTPNGAYLGQWGKTGTERGQFTQPFGIAVSRDGDVFVVELSQRVQRFSASGEFEAVWGGSGIYPGQFGAPWGIAVDAAGDVFVSDSQHNRIQKFTGSGAFLTQWGVAGSGPKQLDHPSAIAVDAAGRVHVVDGFNRRVQVFRPAARAAFTAGLASRATVKKTYSSQLRASGFPAVSSFSLIAGKLPAGLRLSSAGKLSGKPTKAGVFRFTVRANSTSILSTTKSFTVTVKAVKKKKAKR